MGYNVLLLADSTSRWAQAMRETSGRMEEIPGEEAFPAYLDSAIRCVYERSGVLRTNDGSQGTLTLIGTVSPAGGNFEEPVTQSTLNTVKTFLGLSSDRAYRRFYPAIDPLSSWSRYTEQLRDWFEAHCVSGWTERVAELLQLFKRGDEILQMMQVTGEEGVSLEDFTTYQKALFVDMVYLQQDAFDEVDASVPLPRQKESLQRVLAVVQRDFDFRTKDEIRGFFIRLTGLFRDLNYSREQSTDHQRYSGEISALLEGAPGKRRAEAPLAGAEEPPAVFSSR
jgi:V/A-type H+-transporting ATPase subunit A